MTIEQIWRDKTDEQLILASRRLDEYSPSAQAVILAELNRREIGLHTASAAPEPDSEAGESSAGGAPPVAGLSPGWLRRLWHGELSLPVTFWLWGVFGTRAVFAMALLLFEVSGNLLVLLGGLAGWLAYLAFVTVAVWRSSRRYTGPRIWRDLARVSMGLGILRMIGELLAA